MEQLLKIPEVGKRLEVSRTTVYELIARRELPSLTVGKSRRVRESDLDAYIRERAEDPVSLVAAG